MTVSANSVRNATPAAFSLSDFSVDPFWNRDLSECASCLAPSTLLDKRLGLQRDISMDLAKRLWKSPTSPGTTLPKQGHGRRVCASRFLMLLMHIVIKRQGFLSCESLVIYLRSLRHVLGGRGIGVTNPNENLASKVLNSKP